MRDLHVAIYQHEAGHDDDLSDAQVAGVRLDRLEQALSRGIEHHGALDLVVCPELFLSGYDIGASVHVRAELADGPSAARVADMAARFGTAIFLGYPERDGTVLYNALMGFGRDGARLVNYRKRMIPPGFEGEYFTPGDTRADFEIDGWKLSALICYDVEFPEYVRQAAMDGADMVIAPTALRSKWRFVADTMLPTRAFENGLYVLYANHAGAEGDCDYLGRSVILGPDGADLARAGHGEELVTARVRHNGVAKARATLPYVSVVKEGLPG